MTALSATSTIVEAQTNPRELLSKAMKIRELFRENMREILCREDDKVNMHEEMSRREERKSLCRRSPICNLEGVQASILLYAQEIPRPVLT